ncbi:hypothetical protein F4604DRAFT_1919561 [Suillus subluteus]|nr:hypothetical protein F4604DRAFT_1919561 [Suillus subluteus]
MLSTEIANNTFNLVAEKIGHLITRSQKLKDGDPTAKILAHEIAVTLATALAQHGNAATSLLPKLLSCVAEIRDKSGPNGKLKALPDWAKVSEDDLRIWPHPLFHKTVGYERPISSLTQPAVPAPLPSTTEPVDIPQELVLEALPKTSSAPPTPTPAPAKKHNLFVQGNGDGNGNGNGNSKRKAPETDVKEVPPPAPKKAKTSKSVRSGGKVPPQPKPKSRRMNVKSKEFVFDVEGEPVPTDKVIFVKRKPDTGSGSQSAGGQLAKPTPTKSHDAEAEDSTPEDNASTEGTHSVWIFSVQCERCIKDDIPCAVVLGKRQGEIRRCCHNCDDKKTKCVRPDAAAAELLRATVVLKKAKTVAVADKGRKVKTLAPRAKARPHSKAPRSTRSTSCMRPQSPVKEATPAVDEDAAEGEEVLDIATPSDEIELPVVQEQTESTPITATPSPAADNNVNMDPDVSSTMPAAPDVQMDVIPKDPEPTNMQIFQSIAALRTKFKALMKHSDDNAEALRTMVDTRVSALEETVGQQIAVLDGRINSNATRLEENWSKKFSVMEKKIRDMEFKTNHNCVSIGYMANALNTFNQTRNVSAFNPPVGPSIKGHPYGSIPGSWLLQVPRTPKTGPPADHTASEVSKEFTTAWDESKGPQAGGSYHSSASAVRTSGDATQLSRGS